MANDYWRYTTFPEGSVSSHAQRFAILLEQRKLDLSAEEERHNITRWADVVQAFSDAADDAVDQHVRNQREKAEYINAHASNSEQPEEAQGTPHRNSAQSIIVHFNDGSERIIHTHHHIIERGGWTTRMLNGVPFLILGHGIPRQMIPLHNVKSIDLSEELL